ncbi:NF-kappa-B inhibitor cactus-like [Leptidea sinapis]|uniref:NF-kappa-B inhibitor cactus-like n=1 Tax=Leptidea sinapis TaxID=189913 RepID=UPI00213CF40A|nr:NF-kappa-B inhibitor cactus-like [Leptidea sinapis]
MSAKKVFDTKVLDDENSDSGFLSGPISEQLSEDFDSREHTEPTEPTNKSDKNTISENTDLDSGLDLCLSECLSNVNLGDTPTAQAPIIVIEPERTQDIPPLAILFQQDDDGDTQLHIAAVHGCEKSVGTLIRVCPETAWLDVPNNYGHTPLHLAVLSGHAVVTRMLVRAGASLGIRDRTGGTPLHIAVERNNLECLQALLARVPEHPPRKLATVLDQKNYRGQACVHVAAISGHLETLQMLLYYGADINVTENLAGRTALHMAAQRGDVRLVKHLLERCRGVTRDALDYAGRTPRKLAKRSGAARMLANLLGDDDDDSDTDDDIYDSDGEVESLFEKLRLTQNPINVA